MTWIMVDIEADGPIPGDYSMIQIGAVVVDKEEKFDIIFQGKLKPISEKYQSDALQIVNVTREETLAYNDPKTVMEQFKDWILVNCRKGRPFFISDNNGFDFMFVAWYFHHFLGENPFGHSSTNLGSLYKGLVKSTFENFKHLRQTIHTHNPVDDAKGNAEAFYSLIKNYGLKIEL